MGRNAYDYGLRIGSYTAQRETVAALEDRLAKHAAGELQLDAKALEEIHRAIRGLRQEMARRKRPPQPEARKKRDAQIVRAAQSGKRWTDIAKEHGVCRDTVARALRRARHR